MRKTYRLVWWIVLGKLEQMVADIQADDQRPHGHEQHQEHEVPHVSILYFVLIKQSIP